MSEPEILTSRLLGLSYDAPASPHVAIRRLEMNEGPLPRYGWGMVWYPPGERGAAVLKDPTSRGGPTGLAEMLAGWARFRSPLFVGHLCGAAQRIAEEDTHPFVQRHAGSHWVLTHNGQLRDGFAEALDLGIDPRYEPLGRTDTEHMLSWLLWRFRQTGARRLGAVEPEELAAMFAEVNALGTANLVFSDGADLVVYQDRDGFNPLRWCRLRPPHAASAVEDSEVRLQLFSDADARRTVVVVATGALAGPESIAMEPGQMLVIRRGMVTWDSTGQATRRAKPASPVSAPSPAPPMAVQQAAAMVDSDPASGPGAPAPPEPAAPAPAPAPAVHTGGAGGQLAGEALPPGTAIYRVVHETTYAYLSPVERSAHILRLRPVERRHQELLEHSLEISPPVGNSQPFEDVFGNEALKLEIQEPYQELSFVSTSTVRVSTPTERPLHSPMRRSTIPLVWMPWQRQMMTPYLLPEELPEVQLSELFDYAMSFVERQDYDLTETLLDMNRTIYSDFAYIQGATTVETTPFEVYSSRRGVCQDFANLLICLARLLGIPSRYRVGYIYTGANYENKLQSDASHAWAELYLPWFGWQGFDPTNGCLVAKDHIRVACGRHYRDATPTSGTILQGGGGETLRIAVRVEPIQ